MPNVLTLDPLGELHPDLHIPEWLVSNPHPIPYFDGLSLPVTFDCVEEGMPLDARSALHAFLLLGDSERRAASPYVFKNYRDFVAVVGDEDVGCEINDSADVWRFVTPTEIRVSRRPRRDQAIYVQIMAECEWEPEHGLQIVYRSGSRLSRVSDQDGHLTWTDAYDLPEGQDRIA
jgi:hypothetical protein